jgi:hypothetical protein
LGPNPTRVLDPGSNGSKGLVPLLRRLKPSAPTQQSACAVERATRDDIAAQRSSHEIDGWIRPTVPPTDHVPVTGPNQAPVIVLKADAAESTGRKGLRGPVAPANDLPGGE